MPAFTRTGISTDAEIKARLAEDAQMLKRSLERLAKPSGLFLFLGLAKRISENDGESSISDNQNAQ